MFGAIMDGTGNQYMAAVSSDNKLRVRSVSETAIEHATEIGDAYNINTGVVSISADSAILYFKNNETDALFVDAIAVGISDGTASDIQRVNVLKNPTAGTIISGASNVDINVNRNFGSSNTLQNSLAYKGASGNTFTDGDEAAVFFMTDNGRLFASTAFYLPKGSSIGIELDVNLSSGSVNVYAALVCHQEEIV